MGFPDSLVGKESAYNAGDPSSIPGSGRSPGEGIGHPLQYSGLENSMNSIARGQVAKTWTQLGDFHFQWIQLYPTLYSFHYYLKPLTTTSTHSSRTPVCIIGKAALSGHSTLLHGHTLHTTFQGLLGSKSSSRFKSRKELWMAGPKEDQQHFVRQLIHGRPPRSPHAYQLYSPEVRWTADSTCEDDSPEVEVEQLFLLVKTTQNY